LLIVSKRFRGFVIIPDGQVVKTERFKFSGQERFKEEIV